MFRQTDRQQIKQTPGQHNGQTRKLTRQGKGYDIFFSLGWRPEQLASGLVDEPLTHHVVPSHHRLHVPKVNLVQQEK